MPKFTELSEAEMTTKLKALAVILATTGIKVAHKKTRSAEVGLSTLAWEISDLLGGLDDLDVTPETMAESEAMIKRLESRNA
jgi:hypothetical protein